MIEPAGFVKILAHAETDRILGMHLVGANVSELVHEGVLTMEFSGSADDLARICHAHPSLSEVIHDAAMAVSKRAISQGELIVRGLCRPLAGMAGCKEPACGVLLLISVVPSRSARLQERRALGSALHLSGRLRRIVTDAVLDHGSTRLPLLHHPAALPGLDRPGRCSIRLIGSGAAVVPAMRTT